MAEEVNTVCAENLDPRIRRTRLALQQALGRLLETKEFDAISVQEIAEAAAVNRATFYDHYTDKFALLECMVGTRFGELLAARGGRFDGGWSWGGCGGCFWRARESIRERMEWLRRCWRGRSPGRFMARRRSGCGLRGGFRWR